MIDIAILVLLIVIALALGYLIYILRNLVTAQHIEIATQTALKNSAQESNTRLYEERVRLHEFAEEAISDRLLLIEFMQQLWDARDTEAASNWVKKLIMPSVDGHHFTVEECYTGFREDIGLMKP